MRLTAGILWIGAFSFFGCGGNDTAAPVSPEDAGAPSGDAGSDADVTGECASAPAQTFLADLGANAVGFGATIDSLYTLDPTQGNDMLAGQKSGAIVSVPKTGGAPTTFYVPADTTMRVSSFFTADDDVYFIEYNPADAKAIGRLKKLSGDGGAATQVSDADLNGSGAFIADGDADAVYVVMPTSGAAYGVLRIVKASGAYTLIAEANSGLPGNAHVFGDSFYLSFNQGTGPLYKAAISNPTPSQTLVTEQTCTGGIQVVADGAFCGGPLALLKFDPAFAANSTVYDVATSPNDKDAANPRPRGIDGDRLYFSLTVPDAKRATLRQIPISGGPSAAVACNVGNVRGVKWDATKVYWMESRAEENAASTTQFFSQPRR